MSVSYTHLDVYKRQEHELLSWAKLCVVRQDHLPVSYTHLAAISAKTGMGLEKLLEKVALNLPQTHQHLHLLIPYDKSGLIGEIRQTGKVYTEEYREDGTYLDANVELKLCHRVQEYILLNE